MIYNYIKLQIRIIAQIDIDNIEVGYSKNTHKYTEIIFVKN